MRTIFFLALVASTGSLVACGGGGGGENQTAQTTQKTEETPAAGSQGAETTPAPAAEKEANPILERSLKKDPGPADETATIKTNMGTIVLRFYPKQAPLAVANFKGLAAKGYYDGIVFHRVIPGFMIQGGDPTGTGFSGESLWGGKFKDEFSPSLRFTRPGLLAMANSGPNSNGSQFFITVAATPHLNDKHTIFGEVAEGMDVVNAIANVRTGSQDKPIKPVIMESVTVQSGGS